MSYPIQAAPRGFSLIEMLFAMAMAAVLLSLAVPNYRAVMASTSMSHAKNTLLTSLNLARNNAVMHAGNFGLCPSSDGKQCTGGLAWQQGWIVFADADGDGRPGGDSDVIAVNARIDGVAILATAGRERLVYHADGTSAGSNVTLTLCDLRGSAKARAVVISNAGRPRNGVPNEKQATEACALLSP